MSLSIKYNNNHAKINHLGFITHCSFMPLINESQPIYLVLFEEYSRINPFCQPLDMLEDIEIISWDEDRLIYAKKVGEYSFEHDIRITGEGIDWLLSIDPLCTNHSIGLAMPFYKEWCDFSRQVINKDIANYSSFFHKGLYADQHVLDIPCIFADDMLVFGDMKNTYQFFRYKDENSRWVRVTTSTTDEVEFCIRTTSDIQKSYLEKFPEADGFIHKWKSQFKDLGEHFEINIIYQQSETELTKGGVTFASKTPPTQKDLEKFYPILKKELKKYPASFFVDLNISCIQLVVDLWIQTDRAKQKIDGQLWVDGQRGLIFDMQSPVSIIHHEIFHGIQQVKKFYNMPGEISQISDVVQITGLSEYLAELFAMLMTNPGKAHFYAPIEQINYLKEGVKEFVSFPYLSSAIEQRTIFATTPSGIQEIPFGEICSTATRYSSKRDTCQSS